MTWPTSPPSRPDSQLSSPISALRNPQPPDDRPPQRPGRRPPGSIVPQRSAKRKDAGTVRSRSSQGHFQQGSRLRNACRTSHHQAVGLKKNAGADQHALISSWASTDTSTRSPPADSAEVADLSDRMQAEGDSTVSPITTMYCGPDGEYYAPVGKAILGVAPKACPDNPRVVQCPSGDHPMSWVGPFASYEVYFCNCCRSLLSGCRWNCSQHDDDYCPACWPCSDEASASLVFEDGHQSEGACCAIDGRPMAWMHASCASSDTYICHVCSCVSHGDRWHCDEHQDDCCSRCCPRCLPRQSDVDGIAPESSCTYDWRMSTSDADVGREVDTEQSFDILHKAGLSAWSVEYYERPSSMDEKALLNLPVACEGSVLKSHFDDTFRYTSGEPPARVAPTHSERLRRLLDPPPFSMMSNSTKAHEQNSVLPTAGPSASVRSESQSSQCKPARSIANIIREKMSSCTPQPDSETNISQLPNAVQNWLGKDVKTKSPHKSTAAPKRMLETWIDRTFTKPVYMSSEKADDDEYRCALRDAFQIGEDTSEASMSDINLSKFARHLQISVGDVRLAKQAFDHVDTDGDGLICKEGFHMAAIELLQAINKDHLQDTYVQPERQSRRKPEENHLEPEEIKPSEEAFSRVTFMTSGPWRTQEKGPDDPVDLREFLYWYSLIGFREELMLTAEQCELRRHARKYGIPAELVDSTKQVFNSYDKNNDGMIDFEEFSNVVHKLMKIKAPNVLPKSRLQYFWSEIHTDGSPTAQFEDFLQWWLKYYDPEDEARTMPFESFYNHVRRIGPMYLDPPIQPTLDAQEKAELSLDVAVEAPRRMTIKGRTHKFVRKAKHAFSSNPIKGILEDAMVPTFSLPVVRHH